MPVTAHDVAAYTLQRLGSTHTLKMQKLLYYLQAWTLVATDERLFDEEIRAFDNGPVVYDFWVTHRGCHAIHPEAVRGDASLIPFEVQPVVDAVLAFYRPMSRFELIERTHSEDPWKNAWGSRAVTGSDRIDVSEMRDYYRWLALSPTKTPHLPPVKHTIVPDDFLEGLERDDDTSSSETWMAALRRARAAVAR